MQIRSAEPSDWPGIWSFLEPVIRAGEVYALPRDMPEAEARAYWCGEDRETFVAEVEGHLLGSYYIRANQAGGGAHVANGGYLTAEAARGRGIARGMAEHSLEVAAVRGFRAMQFNFVVSSNTVAVGLWRSLGFEVVGVLPGAFEHPRLGHVDVFVMFRRLDAPALTSLADGPPHRR